MLYMLLPNRHIAVKSQIKLFFSCRVQVTGLVIAPTFRDLFDIIPMNLCGYVDGDGYTAEHNGMDEFYPVSEQLKQAVVAIRVKRK